MFDLREFLMKALRDMVGNELDYKIRLQALSWAEKDVLTTEDLAEIDGLIEVKNTPPPEPAAEEGEENGIPTDQSE